MLNLESVVSIIKKSENNLIMLYVQIERTIFINSRKKQNPYPSQPYF